MKMLKTSFRISSTWLLAGALLLGVFCNGGCSLGVMFNKMLTGDPLTSSEFRRMTGEDLTKGKHTLLVMCTTPPSVNTTLSTLSVDIVEGVARRLKREEVKIISPDKITRWIDDNGGIDATPELLAKDFETDYIAWIDIDEFSLDEPNSQDLMRGRCNGFVRVTRVEDGPGGDKFASTVYVREFTIVFPPHQPISETGRSKLLFQKEFVERVSEELSEKFYDHRMGIRF